MSEKIITEEQKQKAAEMIKKIPYPSLLGFELVDLKFGEATLKVRMRDELRQPYGVLHGGATASLIDTAMAFACISCLPEGEKTTTIDLTVHYLRRKTHLDRFGGSYGRSRKIGGNIAFDLYENINLRTVAQMMNSIIKNKNHHEGEKIKSGHKICFGEQRFVRQHEHISRIGRTAHD